MNKRRRAEINNLVQNSNKISNGQKSAKDISEEDLVDLMHEMKEKSCRKNILINRSTTLRLF